MKYCADSCNLQFSQLAIGHKASPTMATYLQVTENKINNTTSTKFNDINTTFKHREQAPQEH
jgi:hypothetical protein